MLTKLRTFLCVFILSLVAVVFLAGKFLIVEDQASPASAIVVIGGDHKPQRIQKAFVLYQQGQAPILIISAGTTVLEGKEFMPEVEVMRRLANSIGLPDDILIIENKSKSTYENALFTKNLLLNQHFESIILVTSAYQSRRARHIFNDILGSEFQISMQPTKPLNNPLLWMFYADERQVVQYEYRNWLRYWVDTLVNYGSNTNPP